MLTTITLPCEGCGKPVVKIAADANRRIHHFCSRPCYFAHWRGPIHQAWKRGRRIVRGYVRIRGTSGDHEVLEHRQIWEQAHGPIPKGSHIHHINGITTDNRLNNLQLLTSANHNTLHKTLDPHKWSRRYTCCIECGKTDQPHAADGKCRRCYCRVYMRAWKKRH